jgi:hypothetical protein
MDANSLVDKYVDQFVVAGFGESYMLFSPMTLLVRGSANHVAPTISGKRDVTQCFICVIVGDEINQNRCEKKYAFETECRNTAIKAF